MKTFVLALVAVSLAPVANAKARHFSGYEDGYPIPLESTSPYSDNIFGPNRSGVAPSTAITQGRSIYIAPRQNGAPTGGVND